MELISEELKRKIEEHPEIDWPLILKDTIKKTLNKVELNEFLGSKLDDSEFSENDANRLGELSKKERLKELKAKGIL